jgi:cob(I)alamin adenosyltransferase
MTRMWTGKGDDGTTGLLYGGRVPKASPRPTAVGDVDEAQAAIGVARAHAAPGGELDTMLIALERDLWVLMAELATDDKNRAKLTPGQTAVTPEMIASLEAVADGVGQRFTLPTEFVVPGQNPVAAALDLARTIVRRAERSAAVIHVEGSSALAYLNRLSSVLWTLARWAEGQSLTTREHR